MAARQADRRIYAPRSNCLSSVRERAGLDSLAKLERATARSLNNFVREDAGPLPRVGGEMKSSEAATEKESKAMETESVRRDADGRRLPRGFLGQAGEPFRTR